jgi:hypothetical protein
MQLQEKIKKLAFELARTKNIVEYQCNTENDLTRAFEEHFDHLQKIVFPARRVLFVLRDGQRVDLSAQ